MRDSAPAPREPHTFKRRRFLAVATGVAAATTAPVLLRADPAQAAPGVATVHWSSESSAPGYQPKSPSWYQDPETGLAAVAHRLSARDDIALTPPGETAGRLIEIDPAARHQTVLGIGSSTEESTVHNLSKMTPAVRTEVLRSLHHPTEGAGFNLTRICFGSSDFTAERFYTYADEPDPELADFSIQRDIDLGIVATLQEALAINPELKVQATPWSAPPWMKDSDSIVGGALLDEHLPAFARYHRLAVQAYAGVGIPIHAVTTQNELGFEPPDYPGMKITPQQEHRLIDLLRREFDDHGLDTLIWSYDWNFDQAATHTATALGTPGSYTSAYAHTAAVALHDYAGEPSVMSGLKESYPDLDVLVNERMVWGTQGADRIAQYFRHHASAYLAWVTMLDRNIAPEQWSGTPDPTALVQDPDDPDTWWALPEYYLFAQYARFVRRGSVRVDSTEGTAGSVTNVAFRNPDDTLATIVVNQTADAQEFTIRCAGEQFTHTLPAKTVGTYVWPLPAAADPAADPGEGPVADPAGRPAL